MVMYGATEIVVCKDNEDLGRTSANVVGEKIKEVIRENGRARVVLAAGESQSSFLNSLAQVDGIEWDKVECLSIDEFYDVNLPYEFTCAYQKERELYSKVNPAIVHKIKHNAPNAQEEADRYEKIVKEKTIDILCQGIGTSGHLGFNEPESCKFDDERLVRVVEVAEQSKRQLRDDPNFKALGYIPDKGITMTIPAILSARFCFTMVPLPLKREILERLSKIVEPTVELPASILLKRSGILFCDESNCPNNWRI